MANRVHGAVCAAGFGVPALIMGNDTRARIGEYVGLDITPSSDMSPEAVADRISTLLRTRDQEQSRLLAHRDATLKRYVDLVTTALAARQ